jgi:hypothetical protein
MILSALVSGAVALLVFSPDQFEYENKQESGSARAVARARNVALGASRNPEQTLDAFGKGLGDAEAIRYLPAGTREPLPPLRGRGSGVPAWFVSNLTIPDLKSYPIKVGPAHAGDIAFILDREKAAKNLSLLRNFSNVLRFSLRRIKRQGGHDEKVVADFRRRCADFDRRDGAVHRRHHHGHRTHRCGADRARISH